MCILYKKSFVKKFQLGDNKPKKNSKARVFQWFIELNPKRNQRHALGLWNKKVILFNHTQYNLS